MMPQRKFTTGLVIDYFDGPIEPQYQLIAKLQSAGEIDEALAVVLPFHDSELSWESRVALADEQKYLNGKPHFDVWHQKPDTETTNSEYITNVLGELEKQYGHQTQVVIYSAPIDQQ